MRIVLNPNSVDDYRLFLRIKALPKFSIRGREAEFPDEYASLLDMDANAINHATKYQPIDGLFDYQRDISELSIRKRKFALFIECGYGKTLCMFEFIRHAAAELPKHKRLLIVSPLMVVTQTLEEIEKWYYGLFGPRLEVEQVPANRLKRWIKGDGERIGITNYDALTEDLEPGDLGLMVLDESGMLKSHYGKWGQTCLRLGAGLEWKLTMTGTPAPNDRIEYANQAVFLDAFPTINSFLAKYFVNRGQTDNRWELKQHALAPFYRDLSHWCIFMTNPATYGWKDNCSNIPPIYSHIHDIELTKAQNEAVYSETQKLFVDSLGGITSRSKLSQIGKGHYNGKKIATRKPGFIKELVESWPDESTIIWCHHNQEQDVMEKTFHHGVSIRGETPYEKRMEFVKAFKSGQAKVMISKPKCLGFGLNLQIATRQVFSGINDSYESFHQAVKRSNRVGSTLPLNVHLPVTPVERPMIENVLRKAHRVQLDTEEQERLFKENGYAQW